MIKTRYQVEVFYKVEISYKHYSYETQKEETRCAHRDFHDFDYMLCYIFAEKYYEFVLKGDVTKHSIILRVLKNIDGELTEISTKNIKEQINE